MGKEYILRVGFGRADITPLEPNPLGGLGGGPRISTAVREPLYTNCIALTDENDETVLLIVDDLCQLKDLTGLKEPIMQATGVPRDHIFISCTHTHSAPATVPEEDVTVRYLKYLAVQMAIAAAQAMTDRKPAKMEAASVKTENMNFSRRYINSEGKPYSNNKGMTMVGPESQADPQLQLVKFVREGAKDIILTNFQTHHHGEAATKWFTEITPNFFGAYRDSLEEQTGCHVAYYSGAGGNLAAQNIYEKHLNVSSGYIDHGVRLAGFAMQAEGSFKPLKAGLIQVRTHTYTGKIKKEPELLELATKVRNFYEDTFDKAKAVEMLEGSAIQSLQHACAIYNNSLLDDTFDVELRAIAVGDLAIATAPCEMYDINGKYVKDHSPFGVTLVFQLTDGSIGYIPSEIAYTTGGYEVEATRFLKGTGEAFQNVFLELFRKMHQA